jgi:16S rRNA processing protein RimM
MAEAPEWVVVAEVLRPHGLRGDLKVSVLSDDPDRLAGLAQVYIGGEARRVTQARPYQAGYLVRLEGVDDAAAAEALRGAELTIPLAEVAPLEPDTYYQWQIVGLTVETTSGERLGTVEEIWPTGANDVLVVTGGRKQYLIPETDEVIKTVDLEAGVITIEPLEGLLDL